MRILVFSVLFISYPWKKRNFVPLSQLPRENIQKIKRSDWGPCHCLILLTASVLLFTLRPNNPFVFSFHSCKAATMLLQDMNPVDMNTELWLIQTGTQWSCLILQARREGTTKGIFSYNILKMKERRTSLGDFRELLCCDVWWLDWNVAI